METRSQKHTKTAKKQASTKGKYMFSFVFHLGIVFPSEYTSAVFPGLIMVLICFRFKILMRYKCDLFSFVAIPWSVLEDVMRRCVKHNPYSKWSGITSFHSASGDISNIFDRRCRRMKNLNSGLFVAKNQ